MLRNWRNLAEGAQDYIKAIEKVAGVPVTIISVGPERDQVIIRNSLK